MPRSDLRIALLQVRSEPAAEAEEQRSFGIACGVTPRQLVAHNLLAEPRVGVRDFDHADVLVLGGAGAHSALDDHPFTAPLGELVERWIDDDRPVFGSCWGHQFLGRLLGATLVHDEARGELGTHDIELTAAGREDPLLAGLPDRFPVQLGHHDLVERSPRLIELARSARCPNQIVRLPGKPVYGTQFHPELRRRDFLARLAVYREVYAPGAEALQRVTRTLRSSPEASSLLPRFLRLYA